MDEPVPAADRITDDAAATFDNDTADADDPGDADLVAEPDDEPDATADTDVEPEAGPSFSGRCRGGPWDGRSKLSRFPQGFLLVDMPQRQVWFYERRPDGDFHVRDENPAPLLDDGELNRWRAAEEPGWDLRVIDPDDTGDDDPGE